MTELAPIIEDEPQAGFFLHNTVRRGPLLPTRIWLHSIRDETGDLMEEERFRCHVAGLEWPVLKVWPYCARRPIKPREYAAEMQRLRSRKLLRIFDRKRATDAVGRRINSGQLPPGIRDFPLEDAICAAVQNGERAFPGVEIEYV